MDPNHPTTDLAFLHTILPVVRGVLDEAPKATAGVEQEGDGRMAFGLTAWRMPDATGPCPCMVEVRFGTVPGSYRSAYVRQRLTNLFGFRSPHIQMVCTARLNAPFEAAHATLARHAQRVPIPTQARALHAAWFQAAER